MTTISSVAARYAHVALRNIGTEFPHATQQVVRRPDAPSRPRDLHPAFHGAYDWHSCVHMHWLAVRLLGEWPGEVDPARLRAPLPGLEESLPATLLRPAEADDASDGHQAHLYGLNLSRAWHYRLLAAALPSDDRRAGPLRSAADRHLTASLPHVTGKGFVSDHWLATFAYLALTA